ncbi:MAG: lipoyl(octanoyl) transferase LipB [Chthoniobacterales bacterium]|nr:lipoyl(octanoyl) transferase LipB [Chthoniobacterales bacterium]
MIPNSKPPAFITHWLGRQSYEEGLRIQEKLVAQKIAGDPQNYFLFLEHESVYTIGRTQDRSSLGAATLPHPLHQIGRGGQATYHGPGQLVCYPILDLHLFGCDLHRYLRFLEGALIELLAGYGLVAQRREGMTGVWIENRKIASLGIGVRKWIGFHGLALNVCGDLSPFEQITPCGLSGVEMTSIEKELGQSKKEQRSSQLSVEGVGEQLGRFFKKNFVAKTYHSERVS